MQQQAIDFGIDVPLRRGDLPRGSPSSTRIVSPLRPRASTIWMNIDEKPPSSPRPSPRPLANILRAPPRPHSWHSSPVRTPMFPASLLVLALAPVMASFGCPSTTGTDANSGQVAAQTQPEPIPATPTPETITGETTSPKPAMAASDTAQGDTDADGAGAIDHTQTLEADPAKSRVGFAVARATTGHIGHFERFTARLVLVGEVPTSLEITVKTGSVVADRTGLTSHLKSGDFFDVTKFPTAIFTTERITAQPEVAPNSFELSGTMHLHGVGRKLKFETTIDVEPDRVVGRAPLDISAKAFGIQYEGMEAELAEDAVQLEIELVFPRPEV